MRYFIDCEFDGHNGALLSMALVAEEDGFGLYMRTFDKPCDPWVAANVMPFMANHQAHIAFACPQEEFGGHLRHILANDPAPVIVADSPVDIGRFCTALMTNDEGGYEPNVWPLLSFEVHDLSCYPTTLKGAVQHNAWWDAMALRHLLAERSKSGEEGHV